MPSKLAVAPMQRVPLQHSIKSAHIITTQTTTQTTQTTTATTVTTATSGQWLKQGPTGGYAACVLRVRTRRGERRER